MQGHFCYQKQHHDWPEEEDSSWASMPWAANYLPSSDPELREYETDSDTLLSCFLFYFIVFFSMETQFVSRGLEKYKIVGRIIVGKKAKFGPKKLYTISHIYPYYSYLPFLGRTSPLYI